MGFTAEEIKEFLTEASELLDGAEKGLLALDQGALFSKEYDAIFRAFHSIKGAAGMMEMQRLQQHMHQLENIFTEQKAKSSLAKPYIEFFLKGVDAARGILEGKQVSFEYQIKQTTDVTAPVAAPKGSAQASDKIGRILLVDDELGILEVIEKMLVLEGFEVISTAHPKEVLSLIEKYNPETIISDIKMPEMNGVELLAEIHRKSPDLPVILFSGQVTKDNLMEAIRNGVHMVLEKPVNMNILIECCLNSIKRYQLITLLNHSINLLLYQFSDLDDFLKTQGKEDIRLVIEKEMNSLIEKRRHLRKANIKK